MRLNGEEKSGEMVGQGIIEFHIWYMKNVNESVEGGNYLSNIYYHFVNVLFEN